MTTFPLRVRPAPPVRAILREPDRLDVDIIAGRLFIAGAFFVLADDDGLPVSP